jgi:RNA polymerase subunit RPABC4/transcription elongation factor Spt4
MRQDYKEIATTVVNDPTNYKVCEVCEAIVDKASPTCPECLAYRFDTDPSRVADRALDMASRPQHAVSHHDTLE